MKKKVPQEQYLQYNTPYHSVFCCQKSKKSPEEAGLLRGSFYSNMVSISENAKR